MSNEAINSINQEKKQIKVFGIPIFLFLVVAIIVISASYFDVIPKNLAGAFAVLLVLGAIFGEIGERIPIWNEYVGGGAILAFLGSAFLVYYGIMPEGTIESINAFMKTSSFLDLFISVLITGSILAVNREILIKAIRGYFPAIIGGIILSFVFGGLVGLIFGKSFMETIYMYALPIMGGGTGAGALPMSEMYESITGNSREAFLSFAFPILTIANIICIILAAILNKIGQKRPNLTGNGELVKVGELDVSVKDKKIDITLRDIGSGLLLATTYYVLGRLMSKVILPSIFGIEIHAFAYMVIFAAISNGFNIIPEELKQGARRLQQFFSGQFLWLMMVGVGVAYTDLGEFVGALTISNIIIATAIVIGAFLGSAIVGNLVGFYPIESGISAGLCMANRGGSGDLAVLGSAKRMELIPYAQISSRIGGGIMLVIASIVFGML